MNDEPKPEPNSEPIIVHMEDIFDTWLYLKNNYESGGFISIDPTSEESFEKAVALVKQECIKYSTYKNNYEWSNYLNRILRNMATCVLKNVTLEDNGIMTPNNGICAATQYYDNDSEVEDKSIFSYSVKTSDSIEIAVTTGLTFGAEMNLTIKEIFELGTSIELNLSTTSTQCKGVEQLWEVSEEITMIPNKRTEVNWFLNKETGTKKLKGSLEISGNVFVFMYDSGTLPLKLPRWEIKAIPIYDIISEVAGNSNTPPDIQKMAKCLLPPETQGTTPPPIDHYKVTLPFEADVKVTWAVESIVKKKVIDIPHVQSQSSQRNAILLTI